MYYQTYLWLIVFSIHGYCADELHPRVYGGEALRPHIHKYLVELGEYNKQENNTYYTYCSGSILSHRWIVSAAHCFDAHLLYVKVVKRHLKIIGYVDKNQITVYPGYDEKELPKLSMFEKDLALLKTRNNMMLDIFTKPVPLAVQRPKIGDAVIIAGYGWSEHGSSVPREGSTVVTKCKNNKTNLICTKSTVRAGPGDSGGALVSKGKLVGIISASCEDVTIHKDCKTVYVDVAGRSNWIKEVMLN